MNHQYGPLTFIKANESGNSRFEQSKDNFFRYLQASSKKKKKERINKEPFFLNSFHDS